VPCSSLQLGGGFLSQRATLDFLAEVDSAARGERLQHPPSLFVRLAGRGDAKALCTVLAPRGSWESELREL
jgi:hypothetical protein